MKTKTKGNRQEDTPISDPYNKPKLLKDAIRRLNEDSHVSECNKKLILDFDNHNELNQTSLHYRMKCCQVLQNIGQLSTEDFDKVRKADVQKLIGAVLRNERWGHEWKKHMLKT